MIENIAGIISKGTEVDEELIKKYEGTLAPELIEIWKEYGYAELLGGHLRVINPDDYRQFVKDTYFRGNDVIPIMTTGFGDVVAIGEGVWVEIISYKSKEFNIVSKGFDRFLSNLLEEYFLKKYLDIFSYNEAVEKLGRPGHDECFGYTPLLGAGGKKKVENLNIVKTREYIELAVQMLGEIR